MQPRTISTSSTLFPFTHHNHSDTDDDDKSSRRPCIYVNSLLSSLTYLPMRELASSRVTSLPFLSSIRSSVSPALPRKRLGPRLQGRRTLAQLVYLAFRPSTKATACEVDHSLVPRYPGCFADGSVPKVHHRRRGDGSDFMFALLLHQISWVVSMAAFESLKMRQPAAPSKPQHGQLSMDICLAVASYTPIIWQILLPNPEALVSSAAEHPGHSTSPLVFLGFLPFCFLLFPSADVSIHSPA